MERHHKAIRRVSTIVVITILLTLLLQNNPLSINEPTSPQSENSVKSQFTQKEMPSREASRDRVSTIINGTIWQTGKPSQLVAHPRGKNERRRYSTPQSRDIPESLLTRKPAMLAMLPEDGRQELFEHEKDEYTIRSRRLVFDPGAFESVLHGKTARLLVPTTGKEMISVYLDKVKTRSPQTHTLQGSIEGDPMSDVQFVYHDGIVHGNVTHPTKSLHYEYRILPDGHMVVRTLDHAAMTDLCGNPNDDKCNGCDDCGSNAAQAEQIKGDESCCSQCDETQKLQQDLANDGINLEFPAAEQGTIEADTAGWTTVDVVVGYGREARIADGGVSQIEARILDAIDRMNTAFSNSQITNSEMMLLGTIEDPNYVFPGGTSGSMSSGDELGNLNNTTDGVLDAVSNYATRLGADFKAFVVKSADGSAGIAYRPGSSSITARTYITSTRFTFAHELGHNLGCDHSWGDSGQSYHPHYGWRFDPDGDPATTTDRVRTIMAYGWGWGRGWRVPYYGNPNVFYGSAPTGAPPGYNASGDLRADQVYVSGSSGTASGFDGTNSALAAQNYLTILTGQGNSSYGAVRASNRNIRKVFSVPTPVAGSTYNPGDTIDIFFIGGDHEYTYAADLYKGSTLIAPITSGQNPATDRNLSWTLPTTLTGGSDYFIRITLSHPSRSDIDADSGQFSITGGLTVQIAASSVSEGDGAGATTATISRPDTNGRIVVTLNSSDTSEITVPNSVVISNGQTTSSPFNLNAIDDTLVDSTQIVTITASASGYGNGQETISVTDDDNNPPVVIAGPDQTVTAVLPIASNDPVAGAAIYLNAGLDDGANNIWEDSVGPWDLTVDTANVTFIADAGSSLPGITSAYEFVGGLTGGIGGCQGASWQGMTNAPDQKPISIELWFKPDASASYPANGQVLWETGGGTGFGIFYNNGVVEVTHDNNQTPLSHNVSTLTDEFIQVVTTYDTTQTSNNFKLYINGDLVSTTSRTDTDLSGSDGAGLGSRGAANTGGKGGGDLNTVSFDGKIAIFRSYHNQILSADDVQTNYGSIANGTTTEGADIYLNAGMDDGANNIWEDSLEKWDLTIDTANVTFVANVGSALPGITSAYDFSGNIIGGAGGCDGLSLQNLGNAVDTKPITIELWFKPDASASYPTNGQVLWETGGSTGFGIFYNNGVIEVTHDNNQGIISQDVSMLADEFIQVVTTYDTTQTTNNFKLYINGNLMQTASRTDTDMSGSDGSGLGNRAADGVGGRGSGDAGTASFDGKIAIFRAYHDQILTDAEILANHNSIAYGQMMVHLNGSANDPDGQSLTTLWTKVSGPGNVTFANASATKTDASFSEAGTYVLRLSAYDGTAQTEDLVTVTVNTITRYEAWALKTFGQPFSQQNMSSNQDGDTLSNLLEFAFGTDPTVKNGGTLSYIEGGEILSNGSPTIMNTGTVNSPVMHAVFGRRKDYLNAGLTYEVQFSANLTEWVTINTPPTRVTSASSLDSMEAVSVPFPNTINTGSGNTQPLFFRISVTGQ